MTIKLASNTIAARCIKKLGQGSPITARRNLDILSTEEFIYKVEKIEGQLYIMIDIEKKKLEAKKTEMKMENFKKWPIKENIKKIKGKSNKLITCDEFKQCSDCGKNVQGSKTWCDVCYKKRIDKWNKEMLDFKQRIAEEYSWPSFISIPSTMLNTAWFIINIWIRMKLKESLNY